MDREKEDSSPREREPSSPLVRWSDERDRYDEIAEYIREVDEILDFIKPFPRDRCPEPGRAYRRSSSTDTADHLENLIKLVEQLKDLKEKDSRMNERTQYLKDLKKLRERKKLLKYEAEAGSPGYWGDGKLDETGKVRPSLAFRKTGRARSKSVNADEIAKDRAALRRERFHAGDEQRRKMSAASQKAEKSKVSKWTKVKEAFRWEKASVDGKRRDEVQYLQVPLDKTPESLSDSPLSGQISASSSVGAPSTICLAVSSGYSGEHSSEGHSTSSGCGMDLPPPPPPLPAEDDFLSLPLGDLSSSSSSEKLDELITYSELLTKGNDRSDLIADSFDAFHNDRSTEDLESRRSKSLDGDAAPGGEPSLMQHLSKDSLTYSKTSKSHKTAWGKVKDIIQTRKGSLKKKPKKRDGDAFSSQSGLDIEAQEDPSSPEDKPKEALTPSATVKPRIELTETTEESLPPASPTKPTPPDSVAKRRLTPVLTITLPSTEELRNISSSEPDAAAVQRQNVSEEKAKSGGESLDYLEDIPRYEKSKTGSYHRFSKWSKVKRAFLTNPRSPEYVPEANSVPSSPNKQISFFSDVESDELSSGEWTDYKTAPQEKSHGEVESPGPVTSFQDEIQKHYLELNRKLTQEFDQKMREWERMKGTETKSRREGSLQKQKSEDWDKMPRSPTRQRDSMAIPLPKLDDLSPEFKKKLDEWKKIKKSQTISAVPGTPPKDEAQGQNFKARIGEWQRWRPRSNHKMSKSEQSEEFAKKLEEWQRIKGSVRRSRSQSDRGKDDSGNRSPSPRFRRKNSKKSSGKSSGAESLSGSLKEKDGRGGSRKQQKEKDLQWLEKELHKIERGKLRLEREKEKFLEREARLEKMKRTMGTTSPTQEILIKTPTGFFRFEGISQKFTKKLYEWEKARGIAPEASTFALLEEYVNRGEREERGSGMSLQRSKSMGSVMEMSSAVQDLGRHPSSLSLNDVDELDVAGMESRASSEPTLAGMGQDEEEPQAIIVDVEDVVEETAALMADEPAVKGEVPVYSYAPTEVTQLIDSSGSESESEIRILGQTEFRSEVKRDTETIREFREESEGNEDAASKHSPEVMDVLNHQEAVTRVHELSSQLLSLAEKLELAISDKIDDGKAVRASPRGRRKGPTSPGMGDGSIDEGKPEDVDRFHSSDPSLQELEQLPSLITNTVLELKSGLSVLKSAAESPVQERHVFEGAARGADPGKESPTVPKSPRSIRNVACENGEPEDEPPRGLQKSRAQLLYGETAARDYDKHREVKNSPELIKRKIKEKISLMQRMTTESRPRMYQTGDHDGDGANRSVVAEDADEKVVIVRKEGKQKKLLKTRRVTDTNIAYTQVSEDAEVRKKPYAIPVTMQRFTEEAAVVEKTPVNVFVPTTRKIISPVRRDSKGTTSVLSYRIDDITPRTEAQEEAKAVGETPAKPPVSPSACRREGDVPKEKTQPEKRDIGIPPLPSSPLSPRKLTSPGIRMMIAKYNQKIEQGSSSDTGTCSPSWRSPIFERKLKEPVQKSASGSLLGKEKGVAPEQPKGILKSSSAGQVKEEVAPKAEEAELSLRALRIKKAKEEFLSRGPGGGSYTSAASTPTAETPPNRLSSTSVGSESSLDEAFDSSLVKSVSAGTINLEDGSRRSSDVERSDDGRPATAKATSSKFGISSIKSKFRKVRMKKGKEKPSAVSTLCRQSLLLEVPIRPEPLSEACGSKSCPSSPVLERSRTRGDSWRRMFKREAKSEAH